MSQILSDGISIAITGYLIVFLALALFFAVFNFLPKILKINIKKIFAGDKNEVQEKSDKNEHMLGSEVAAISTAIYMYLSEQHDEESYDVTIRNIKRRYSPWSSKIYSMNNTIKR